MGGYRRLDNQVSGSFTPSGLTTEGKITHLSVGTSWTALPATPLSGRNAIEIVNRGAATIFIEFDNAVATGNGRPLGAGQSYFIDITDDILVYASTASGSVSVTTVEVA